LDAHIADLRERLDGLAERGRHFDAFLASIETIRMKAAAGALSHADKRDIIELLDSRVYAWTDEAGRHVRVELPLGARCVNSNRTMTRTN
jgi:hypothetical protein